MASVLLMQSRETICRDGECLDRAIMLSAAPRERQSAQRAPAWHPGDLSAAVVFSDRLLVRDQWCPYRFNMRGISIKAIFLATLAVLGIDIVWFRLLGLGLTLPAALLGARISQRQG